MSAHYNEPGPCTEQWSGLMNALILEYAPTGSRIICNPPPTDTDYDILIRVPETKLGEFTCVAGDAGWKHEGAEHSHKYEECRDFLSLRKGAFNLIVTDSEDFYRKFDAATHVAKRLNLLNKQDRIALFQAVLYANKHEGNS